MERKSSENIAAALKLLEEAADQKKEELRTIMADNYKNLRGLIMENEIGLVQSMTAAKDHAIEATTRLKDAGIGKAQELAGDVDKGVHQNPWAYIAGSMAAGVVVGHLLSRSRK